MDEKQTFFDGEFVREITASQAALRSYIWKMVGDPHWAEDVLQKTNMVIWDKRMDWDPTTVFLRWAYRIAYFQSKAYLRDRMRENRRLIFDSEVLTRLAESTPTFESMDSLQEALGRCLDKIDKKKRGLLLERYEGDNSVQDLAAKHDVSANTLSQLLRRLRIKLSDCISKQILDMG